MINTKIMGVLNVTPDSFYDGGKYSSLDTALARAEQMVNDGVDIIDVGGESTRPGAEQVSLDEELKRTIPVVRQITRKFNVRVSIDTYKSEVAGQAADAGASMINDISGLTFDSKMADVVVSTGAEIVIMHIKGAPKNMQVNPEYVSVTDEINGFLDKQAKVLLDKGVNKGKIIVDPGIGFGKTTQNNLEILSGIKKFKQPGYRLLVGVSMKSFIGNCLGSEQSPLPAVDRGTGTTVAHVWLMQNNIDIIRVHDVKAAKQTLKMLSCLNS